MKKILQEYGFTIILSIVVITLLVITNPLGSSIKETAIDIINGFGAKTNFNKIETGDMSNSRDSAIDITNINVTGVVGDFSTKGNIVTIYNNRFKVLNVNGTKAKVMSMNDIGSAQFGTGSTISFGSDTGQKYADSDLDNAMNNYYNSLPEAIQNAIIEQNINQSIYKWEDGTNSNANFSSWYKGSFVDSDTSGINYSVSKTGSTNTGNRKVYALDVDDVVAYLGSNSTPQKVNEMFFDNNASTSEYVWLRSAHYGDADSVFCVNGYNGSLFYFNYSFPIEVRPTFFIDVSLLA